MSIPHPPSGEGRARAVPILRLPTNRTRVVIFLGPLRGSVQHWTRGRTQPCLGDAKACPCHRDPVRYFAYAPALVHEAATGLWLPVVAQATSALEQQLRGRVIRGECWALTREPHEYNRGAIYGKFLQMQDVTDLRVPFDVEPTLFNAFGVTYLPPHQENPFPDKLTLPPSMIDLKDSAPEVKPTRPPEADKLTLSEFLKHLKKKEEEGDR